MVKGKVNENVLSILENPTYLEVLLSIIIGKNYATAIARYLGKKQPTVTEQLKELEKFKLIRPLKREKSQKYEVNWDLLLETFYDIINETLKLRGKDFLSKEEEERIKKIGIKKIVPPMLIKDFLKEYFIFLKDLGGKRKGFDEIIFSFFCALNNLEESSYKKLIRKFGIDEKALKILANLMAFEIYGIEQTALETYLTFSSKK
jgi:DNA-binding transcriptional ArsR family regulator